MDYREKIFEMLGVKANEEFRLCPLKNIHRLTNELSLEYKDDHGNWRSFRNSCIKDILTGLLSIVKTIIPTKEEQVCIEYARLLGCNWLAKDKRGATYGYENKPCKDETKWRPKGQYWLIEYPISFLSWDDEEPYYIGD